jgi:hypothetical protein
MPAPDFEPITSKKNLFFMVSCFAILCGGIMIGVFFWARAQKLKVVRPETKSEPIHACVHFEGPYITLRNQNHFTWDNEMLVYIGNAPPEGYSHRLGIVYPGDTISLALNEFVNGNGEKFNAYGLGVAEAWIGGKDQAFQNFQEAGASGFYGTASEVKK